MSDLDRLRQSLDDPDEEARHLAVQELAGLGREALDSLGRALGDPSWRVRKAALEAFVAVPGEEKVELLLQGIRDEESAGRRNTCMEALIRLGEASLPYLPSLLDDSDPDVRKFGVDILGNIEGVGALEGLMRALDDDEDNVAAAAAEYLGRKRYRPAIPKLVTCCLQGGFWVKFSCVKALGDIGDPAGGSAVLESAGEPDLRNVSLEALGRMGVAEAEPYVVEGLFSEDKGLRKTATVAAARILEAMKRQGSDTSSFRRQIRENSTGQFASYLESLLRNEDQELRTAAMQVLGAAVGKDALDPVLEMLSAAGEEEQAAIAEVLSGLPEEDLSLLFPKLRSEQQEVRQWVARILGQRTCEAAVPHIVGLLEDENGHVRAEAARALGRIGDKLAVSPLVSLLSDPYPDVRQAGVDALGALGGKDGEMRQLVLNFLGPQLDSRDQDLVANALKIVARLGSRDVLDRLQFALKDERSQIRRAAVEALGSIEDGEAVEVLRIALTDEDAAVRREAVQIIGGKKREDTLPILMPMLLDEDLWVRVRAVQAVAEQESEEARGFLLEAVRNQEAGPVRLAAIRALGKAGGEAAETLLLELAAGGDRESRMAAIESLGQMGGERAVDSLLARLGDDEWGLRSAAVRALGRFLGDGKVSEALEKVSREDPDPMVRKTAGDLLGSAPA